MGRGGTHRGGDQLSECADIAPINKKKKKKDTKIKETKKKKYSSNTTSIPQHYLPTCDPTESPIKASVRLPRRDNTSDMS